MSENKDYMTLAEENGTINISEEVIASIAMSAVQEVEGVSGLMANMSSSVTELFGAKKNAPKTSKAVKLEMTEEALNLDLYITVKYGCSIPEVAENAQKAVFSTVEAMTGCAVTCVNIHVGGVTFD